MLRSLLRSRQQRLQAMGRYYLVMLIWHTRR